jgi:hypothetical protein
MLRDGRVAGEIEGGSTEQVVEGLAGIDGHGSDRAEEPGAEPGAVRRLLAAAARLLPR